MVISVVMLHACTRSAASLRALITAGFAVPFALENGKILVMKRVESKSAFNYLHVYVIKQHFIPY